MGLWESAVGFAAIVGPLVGGFLVVSLGWPSIYIVISIISGAGILLGLMNIPPDEQSEPLNAFDWRGAVGFMLMLLALLMGITRKSLPLILLGILTFGVWVYIARRTSHPFIRPRMLKNKQFLAASGAASLRMVIGIACIMSLPLFLEGVQKLSPVVVGFLLPTYSLFLFLGARPGGKWADRAGSRLPGLTGFVLMTIGVGMMIFMDESSRIVFIGVALAIRGIGAGISQSPFAKVATSAFGPEHTDVASGLYGMFRYSGLALGSALVGILLDTRLAFYGSNGRDAAAVPAFQELFIILALVGLVGITLSWYTGKDQSVGGTLANIPVEAANG